MEIISTSIPELKTLASLTGKKSELQAIQFLLLAAEDGELNATGSDFEVGMTLKLNAQVLTGGSLVAPPSLADLLSDGKVINLASQENTLKIDKDGFKGSLNCLPAAEYPPIPTVNRLTNAFSISAAGLEHLLGALPFAEKKDLGRGTNGVYLSWDAGKARSVAVDGFKAVMVNARIDGNKAGQVLLSASGIHALQKFVAYHNPDETLRCGMVDEKFAVKSGIGFAWAGTMADVVKFPADNVVKAITGVAAPPAVTGTIHIGQLRYAVNQIKTILGARENPNSWFVFGDQELTISANDTEVGGGTAVVDLPMDNYAEDIRHAYNLGLVEPMLAAFGAFVDGDTCPIVIAADPATGFALRAASKAGMAACKVWPVAPSVMGGK